MESTKIQRLEEEIKLFPYLDLFPELGKNVFLAPGCKLIGDVKLGDDSSVWYNCVLRGDVHYIKIGYLTNVQDCSMIHVTNKKYPVNIGNKVTIGHSVTLHGCTIQDLSLIGMGSVVLDGAVVETNSIVAAGAVVRPGFIVPAGKLVAGVPAKIIRDLTQAEIDDFEESAKRYKKYSELTANSLYKVTGKQ